MNAQEMFEKLGFRKTETDKFTIEYEMDTGFDMGTYLVVFHLITRLYSAYANDFGTISVELHLAITQQMKELGWLE